MKSILFFYSGKKGGPNAQLESLVRLFTSKNIEVHVILNARNSEIHKFKSLDSSHFHLYLWSFKSNPSRDIHSIYQLFKYLKDVNTNLLLNLMPHPLDFIFYSLERRIRKPLGTIIHDSHAHKGESWPTLKSNIRRIRKSHVVIFHSAGVQDMFAGHLSGKVVYILTLFYLPIIAAVPTERIFDCLIIGRGKKYQGRDTLPNLVRECERLGLSIHVAGSGFTKRMSKEGYRKTTSFTSGWLSDSQFESLVRKSKCVVLNYSEATQSGIVSMALAVGTPVVVTPIDGLRAQIRIGIDGEVADSFDPNNLALLVRKVRDNFSSYEPRTWENLEDWLKMLNQD